MADHYQGTRYQQSGGPSSSQVVAVVTLLPLGGILLLFAGFALTGTLIGLAVATPVFVIFSPVLVPAALTIALAISGFVISGAFGVTALSALSWMVSNLRRARLPEQFQRAKQRAQETAVNLTDKAKEAEQAVQGKPQEVTGKSQSNTQEATGGKTPDAART